MCRLKFNVDQLIQSMMALLLAMAVMMLPGCGGGAKSATGSLPANVMTHPRGLVGVLTTVDNSPLFTTLRALGIPYRRMSPVGFAQQNLAQYKIFIVDEEALDDEAIAGAYRIALTQVKYGSTMILLRQETKVLQKTTARLPRAIVPRDLDHRLQLVSLRRSDPALTNPNPITGADLDSLSRSASQITHGSRDARAIIAASLTASDSSAILLWEPYEDGTIWYLSIPITARAAGGFSTEQKLLANLLTNK